MDKPQVIKDLELAYGKTFVKGKYEEYSYLVNEKGEVTELSRLSKVSSLEPISKITSLEVLMIEGFGTIDLESIQNLTRLKHLMLNAKPIDLTPLKSLKNLESLRLSATRPKQPLSLEPLSHMKKLKSISIDSCNVSGFEFLKELRNLEQVYLGYLDFNHIQYLVGSNKMRVLKLENTKLDNLSALSQLSNLEHLEIASAKITDLNPLRKLQKLKRLRLYLCNLNKVDLNPLENLHHLNNLHLVDCDIDFIPHFMSNYANLKFAYFANDYGVPTGYGNLDFRFNRNIKNIHPKILAKGKVPISEIFSVPE